ncbi:MAG TPA: RNA-binding S4 domain-containing protein [Novosphingobium sp.]|nr:RNA-binding S4 domain-containing protein [Novosphingobium sp.]
MRIDKLLWFLRLARTRPIAQAMAEQGHIRLNGRRVDRAHQKIAPGDVLTLPLPSGVRIIEVLSLPARRGPAAEALGCYRRLDGNGDHLIAAGDSTMFEEGNLQP